MYLTYTLTVAYLPNFSSLIAFTYMVRQPVYGMIIWSLLMVILECFAIARFTWSYIFVNYLAGLCFGAIDSA